MRKRPGVLLKNVDKEPAAIYCPISCWFSLGNMRSHRALLSIKRVLSYFISNLWSHSVSPFTMTWINVCCVCESEFDGFVLHLPFVSETGPVWYSDTSVLLYCIYLDLSKYVRGDVRPSGPGEKWQLTPPIREDDLNIWAFARFFFALQ